MNEKYDLMVEALLKGGDFLDEIGLDFMLAGGTLLGAIRGGELIRHDHDVDISVLIEDLTKEHVKQLTECNMFMAANHNCHYSDCHITLQFGGCHFDIFPLHKWNDVRLFNQAGDKCLVWPSHYCDKDKWEKVTVHGREWNTPKDPEKFLEVMYGKKWRIPDKEFQWEQGLNYKQYQDIVKT